MDDNIRHLPWSQLQHTAGPIPWSALDEFADALVEDPAVWKDLATRYNELMLRREAYFGCEELYIPAIFAKAAGRLGKGTILEIGPFLVEKLCEAGYDDDDILLEAFSAACGSMGTAILPTVLDFIIKEENTYGAWVFLWGLLRLAERADDHLRSRVIDFCVKFLKNAEQDETSLSDAEFAADTIAHLGCTEYLGVLKSLEKKSRGTLYHGEYAAAARILAGNRDPHDFREMWDDPVESWLPPRWQMYRDWLDKNRTTVVEDNEEFDVQQYRAHKLVWRFLRSAAAAELSSGCSDDAGFVLRNLLDYAWTHEGAEVEELSEPVLRNVLFSIFPRKVAADEEMFRHVSPVTAAFLSWLAEQKLLADGHALASRVADWSDQIVSTGMDPSNWSVGKGIAMKAEADGVDFTDREAMQRYLVGHNLRMLHEREMGTSWPDDSNGVNLPMPVSEFSGKVGRNQPCPCGSGKKYKKCCGSPNAPSRVV